MVDYSIETLERGIEAIKKNIQTFEDAITKERNTISEYYGMIEVVQRKKKEAEARDRLSKEVTANDNPQ